MRQGRKILDRTALILEIFSMRAKSRKRKLQVELARLQYELPRLTGQGNRSADRAAAGAHAWGRRSKAGTDKRRIRRRIFELKEEIRLWPSKGQTQRENV